MQEISRIQELVGLCNNASYNYYTLDSPIMSDKEYDQIYDELVVLEKKTGYILSNSPTQKVQGDTLPYLTKVQHTEPMLSADKSKDINDIIKFMGEKDCVLSWKLDGLTIVLKYKDGKLFQAITRGRGVFGEDVTHTVKTFTNVPLTIDYKGYLEIRGEGLVTFKEFERINQELISQGEEPKATARNLAAGSVRQLDANITKSRKLIFIAFGIVNCDNQIFYKNLQLEFLKSLGFDVVFYNVIDKSVISESVEMFQSNVETLPYPTDGLIVEYNDIVYGKSQGSTGHHSKALYAFKWNDDSYESVFRGIETKTTRTGMGSLTALFDPIEIDGTIVSRASVHNVDIFEDFEFGIGDKITVYKANMIIPQIDDNLDRSGTYQLNMKCPSCGSNYVIKQPKDARYLFCENLNCPAKLLGKLTHFVSNDAMNIDGLSEATIEKLLDEGFIEKYSDIYQLEKYKDQIIKLDGFGKRSYEKLIESIEKSKNVDMDNFIYALGITQIGKGGAKRLAKHFKNNIYALLDAASNIMNFMCIDDIGDISAQAIYDYFNNDDNANQIHELLSYVKIKQIEMVQNNTIADLTGKTFVVTGSVNTFKNRNELEELITLLNGKLSGSVSAKTNYLINNDTTSTSGKNQKAQQLGVPIISENDFNKMVGRNE